MITQNNDHFNENNDNIQNKYDNSLKELEIKSMKCSCGLKGQYIKHSSYKRTFKVNGRKRCIYIQRIYCKHCGRTHAILPSFLVPYKRNTLKQLIEDFELFLSSENSNEKLTPEEKRNVPNFKKWKNILISMDINLNKIIDDIKKIIVFCAKHFSMCLFQSSRRGYTINGEFYNVNYLV